MKVSVGLNASNKREFLDKLYLAKKLFPKHSLIHADISKKGFSSVNSFVDFRLLKTYSNYFDFEGHLMVSKKDVLAKKWYVSPLKILFIHTKIGPDWRKIFKLAKKYKKEIGVAVNFNENRENLFIPVGTKKILVLAVIPGKSGQEFNPKSLNLISFLRKKYPHATIIIDGGVTPKIAARVKRLGAREIVSTSYIWGNENPLKVYKEFKAI